MTTTTDRPMPMRINGFPIPELLPQKLGGLTTRTKDELIALIHDMAHDWQLLNGIHNNRAHNNDWCSDYESNQIGYNQLFRVLQLRPRSDLGLRGTHNTGLL
jgi:hypothetical protein